MDGNASGVPVIIAKMPLEVSTIPSSVNSALSASPRHNIEGEDDDGIPLLTMRLLM